MLKQVKIICPWLQHSLPSFKLPLEATPAQELFFGSFMKWVSMAEQPQPHKPKITMRNDKCRRTWCTARRHWTLEKWKRLLWSDESLFIIWQSD
jgi:hypothetical protein